MSHQKDDITRTASKRLIGVAVTLITLLLAANFILTLRNNRIIEENHQLQRQAEQVRVTISQFAIIIIHNVDLGVRSYALFNDQRYLPPFYFANRDKDSLMTIVERALVEQQYPLEEFNALRDSINSYVNLNWKLIDLFKGGMRDEFIRLADQDKGYELWLQYEKFAKQVNAFEDEINGRAQVRMNDAETLNYLIQFLIFFICIPTLLITAYNTYKKFSYEVKLRKVEAEKSDILATQNEKLERIVVDRTAEIQNQNRKLQVQHEEISKQNEKILGQNDELHRQREELAVQFQALADSKKEQLEIYTRRLHEKSELIEKLSNEIELIKKRDSVDNDQVQNFNKVLHSTILTEDDWEKFRNTFDQVYPNFFANLRYRFPDITASELRLSALIKMNLTLKEAANTLGISAESVKKSRYRLKKKISLGEEDSLEAFIRGL